MSAEVETMFYTREKPWHGLGTRVEEAPTSSEALELAGLNWEVNPLPIYDAQGNEINGYKANTRSSDNSVLGIVGSRYKVVQNKEAFDFTDALIGDGVRYETAGSLRNGRTIWLLARMPETKILGEDYEPYVCFTNAHDGTGAVRACMTPVRVVCNNTLNLALSGAKRSWSTPHRGDPQGKLAEARQTLALADAYLKKLDEQADKLANEKLSVEEVQVVILPQMFQLANDATERMKRTAEYAQSEIMACMLRPDLAQFLNTKWGFINAVSDYIGHSAPVRMTKNFEENRWGAIIGGHAILDKALAMVSK